MFTAVNPYPDDAPLEVLKRPVQIVSATWGPGTGLLVRVNPLRMIVDTSYPHRVILGAITGVFGDMGMYRYLRCGFKITVKVNSTPYHQGCLCAFWYPLGLPTANESITECCAWNAIFLSASQQDQCEMHIPFIHQKPHWDLSVVLDAQVPKMALTAINSLRTSSATITDSVPYEIFIQMEDISIYGIQPQTVPLTHMKVSERTTYKNFKSDSKPDKEAEAKDMLGMAAKGALQVVKPMIMKIPFAPTLITLGKFVFGNLDKPNSQSASTFTIERHHRAHCLLKGLDTTEPLAQDPSFNVTQEVDMTTSAMQVTTYAQKPTLYVQYKVVTPGTIASFVAHPMAYVNATRVEPDFLAFASSFYAYWRGSIKYMFHFIGTPFYSARFKISVATTPYGPVSTTLSGGTGYFSRIIDVKGDAFTSITVPYLNPQVWSNMGDIANASHLIIELLSPIQGSSLPADAIYYLNVFRAAANDYQLALLTNSQNLVVLPESEAHRVYTGYKSDTSLDSKFAECTEGVTLANQGFQEHGLFMADTSGLISDTLKRFVQHTILPGPPAYNTYPNTPLLAPTILSPFHFWQFGFCYWRGSRRVKNTQVIGPLMSTLSIIDPQGNTTTSGHALSIQYDDVTTGLQTATVPWYLPDMFFCNSFINTNSNTAPIDVFNSSAAHYPFNWIAAGDDFTYLMVRPPIVAGVLLEQARARKEKARLLAQNVQPSTSKISQLL